MTDPRERQTSRNDNSPSLAEILDVFRPQVERIEEAFTAIRVTLDALANHLQDTRSPAPATSSEPVPVAQPILADKMPEAPAAQEEPATEEPMAPAGEPPIQATRSASKEPPPVGASASPKPLQRAEPIAVRGGEGVNWSGIVFGQNVHVDSTISHLSGALLADVYQGDQQAIALAGQLMAFRSGTAEQKARLLKEVGESFYAWRPHGDDDLLQALITWVHTELDAVQLGNRIQVVQVGDRYDMQRHNAKQAGVEVADVFGWIVLRDNGKVFSKASVAVK
jgi:hypothetical protein